MKQDRPLRDIGAKWREGKLHSSQTPRRNGTMNAINDLYEKLRERRRARRRYRAAKLDPWIARDIGLDTDGSHRRHYYL